MTHLDFVLWMVLWPLCNSIGRGIAYGYISRPLPDKDILGLSAIIETVIWAIIGVKLWGSH